MIHVDGSGEELPIMMLPAGQHVEYQATTRHAWRIRTIGGRLLTEIAGVELPVGTSDLVSVHILSCGSER